GRLVLSGAVGAASRREVWEMGRWGDKGDKENNSQLLTPNSTVISQQSTLPSIGKRSILP
ncbi:hypothetical protein, partial [Nostoc sp. 2RC]|uniref:hypothetical protein n=1 Tax=Nostoc sp. 2RC TaxID=2485484 RepID=UPI001C8A2581